ncbi:MAG TPA: hypothetical protein PK431_01015 [Chitinophagales bacterium]|nr:hypothetical protein [Chitinophagales bacterium]
MANLFSIYKFDAKISSTEIKNLRDLFTNKVTAALRIVLLDETSKEIVLEKI